MSIELDKILTEIESYSDYYRDICPLVLMANGWKNYEPAKQFLKMHEKEFGMVPQYPVFFPDVHIYGTKIQAKNLVTALFGTNAKYAPLRKYFKKDISVFAEPTVVCSC